MGAIRIQVVTYSEQGVKYRVNIWDNDYGGSTITNLNSNGFELEYDRIDRFLSPIISSSCYFNLFDDGSGDFATFISDLANAQENEFKLYIERWDGAAYQIYWAGLIMSDLVSWDNTVTPRPFEIVAKDGINRLEKIYFDKITAAPYTTLYQASVFKIIFDCLSYADTAQFWNGSSQPYITAGATWHDTLQTAIAQADVLRYIHVGKEYLVKDPAYSKDFQQIFLRGADDPPLFAKEILEGVLQIFALRLIQSEGSWHIQQVSNFTATSTSVGTYDYLGAYIGAFSTTLKLTHNGSTLAVLAGGKFGYYPSVRLAKAQVYPSTLLRGYYNLETAITESNRSFTSSTFNIGTIYGGVGSGLKLKFVINYNVYAWPFAAGNDWYIEVGIKIQANTNRIKNALINGVYATNGTKGGEAAWSTTSADKYKVDVGYQFLGMKYNSNGVKNEQIVITTPEIPFAKEDATLIINAELKSVKGKTNWPSNLSVYFSSVDICLIDSLKDPPAFAQVTEIERTNSLNPSPTSNSIEIDYGMLKITDNVDQAAISSVNTILVTQPNAAGTLSPSTTWVAGYSSDESLVATLLKETIAMQKSAVKKYTGPYRSTVYHARNSILYDSEIWVFMGGRYNSINDQWDGEWFGIAQDFSAGVGTTTRGNDIKGVQWGPKGWFPPFDPSLSYPVGPTPNGLVGIKIDSGGTVVKFDVDAIAYRHVRSGDTIYAINPNTMQALQGFNVTTDVEIGDVEIDVTSETADGDIWQGYYLAMNPREVTASNTIRGNNFQIQQQTEQGIGEGVTKVWTLKATTLDATSTTLTTDGLAVSGTTNVPHIPDEYSASCVLVVGAKKAASADCFHGIRQFLMVSNGAVLALEGAVQTVGTDIVSASLTTVTVTATANDPDNTISIDVTGEGSSDLNWTAQLTVVLTKNA